MEAKTQRILKSGWEFDHLFPKAKFSETTVKKSATVEDTIRFIPEVIRKTRWQVKRFVNQELDPLEIGAACEKLWHFVKDHIGYCKDESGKEQIRTSCRLWADKIGDCDCYTVFISSCLTWLHKKLDRVIHRITKYGGENFQHIYPVVITPDGRQIIIDCVVDHYNYEELYTEKKDYTMDLNYLDGVPGKSELDAQFDEEQADLGKLFENLKNKKTNPTTGEKKDGKVKTALKKTLNVVNKVNPATVLLRAGVLAAMKLNFMKVAQRLKYGYLSDAEAQKRGVDMVKFQKLKTIKTKLENIFYGAGGKPENLKEAILMGKGNPNKEVPLSGFYSDDTIMGMNQSSPLTKVIGQEIYYSEFMDGNSEIEGLGSLGEPITAASIAAASGVMAAIAALLKNVGSIFPKLKKESADFDNVTDANLEAEKINAAGTTDLEKLTEELQQENTNVQNRSQETDDGGSSDTGDDAPPEGTWWERNKKWFVPTLWGTGILSALGIGYAVFRPKNEEKAQPKKEPTMAGLKTKKKKPKASPKQPPAKKLKAIELK
jgi:hypothetical protein